MGAAPQASRESYFQNLNGRAPTAAFVASSAHANMRLSYKMQSVAASHNGRSINTVRMAQDSVMPPPPDNAATFNPIESPLVNE